MYPKDFEVTPRHDKERPQREILVSFSAAGPRRQHAPLRGVHRGVQLVVGGNLRTSCAYNNPSHRKAQKTDFDAFEKNFS